MNIYFSGIGGVGIGPLAEIARDAGYQVQGSDLTDGLVTRELTQRGIAVHVGPQDGVFLQECHDTTPLDWFVYTSALPDDHAELTLARQLGLRVAKRDELLAHIIAEKNLKLIAVAGTHGKTTTTGMMIWCLEQLGIPVSYSIGTTISFGPSGKFDPASEYFVYECDEFDRNFLHFSPFVSLITAVDYDHPDTYPSKESYFGAFRQFIDQSKHTIMWQRDKELVAATAANGWVLGDDEVMSFRLAGNHNRRNATLVYKALEFLKQDNTAMETSSPGSSLNRRVVPARASQTPQADPWSPVERPKGEEKSQGEQETTKKILELFPGTDRRFEKLADNLYSDYGHHPVEIAATLQLARELSDHVVLVYQPHQNIRQHDIKNEYTTQFELADEVYWLPTYLSREDPNLPILQPEELIQHITNKDVIRVADFNDALWDDIQKVRDAGKLVLCMGAGTIDGWLREQNNIRRVANVLVIDVDGNFILQQRDDKPEINNPGMITGFGGAVEDNETVRQAAIRELREETNLNFREEQLRYHKTIFQPLVNDGTSRWVTYFILSNQDVSKLEVYEGQGYAVLSPNDTLESMNLSDMARQAIKSYWS